MRALALVLMLSAAVHASPRACSVRLPLSVHPAPGQPSTTHLTDVLPLGQRFDRIVPWWNARTADGGEVTIEALVHRDGKPLGGWLTIATWSKQVRGHRDTGAGDVTLDQDTLKVTGGADAVQLRATVRGHALLTALGVTAFRTDADASPDVTSASGPVTYPVKYRSQRDADPAISARICGPTSLSMALAFRGVELPTESVAALAKDPPGPIPYGNWAYLAATAAELGVASEVRAMDGLDDVVRELKAGNLVILALAFKKKTLSNAPISSTVGHLVLARGFDVDGNIFVNDPAGHGPADGQVRYRREELARAWRRGIGIVIRMAQP